MRRPRCAVQAEQHGRTLRCRRPRRHRRGDRSLRLPARDLRARDLRRLLRRLVGDAGAAHAADVGHQRDLVGDRRRRAARRRRRLWRATSAAWRRAPSASSRSCSPRSTSSAASSSPTACWRSSRGRRRSTWSSGPAPTCDSEYGWLATDSDPEARIVYGEPELAAWMPLPVGRLARRRRGRRLSPYTGEEMDGSAI